MGRVIPERHQSGVFGRVIFIQADLWRSCHDLKSTSMQPLHQLNVIVLGNPDNIRSGVFYDGRLFSLIGNETWKTEMSVDSQSSLPDLSTDDILFFFLFCFVAGLNNGRIHGWGNDGSELKGIDKVFDHSRIYQSL